MSQSADPGDNIFLPPAVRQRIEASYGLPESFERLNGGLSTAQIWRLHWPHRTLILKGEIKAAESYFYQHIAPVLREAQVPVPEVYLIVEGESAWLLLEDIPHPLPRSRWQADPAIAQCLARLHRLPLEQVPQLPPAIGYQPVWDHTLTEKALACFDESNRPQLRPRLYDLMGSSQHLFEPRCAISGDSNPTNWGLRQDGTVVLYDWERFTFASPAIDLAISIGGLGSRETCSTLAGYYLQACPDFGLSHDQLTNDMLLAKLFIIVEFLSLYTDGLLKPDDTLSMLAGSFRDWLDALDLT